MSQILPILKAGSPLLYQQAKAVTFPLTPETLAHARHMIATLKNTDGLALAAPQVGIPLQMLVINIPQTAPAKRYDFSSDPDHKAFPLTVLVNPTLSHLSEEKIDGWESCLSFPGYRGKVSRHRSLQCDWFDLDGKPQSQKCDGFNARVIQHEFDHLHGTVYVERIKDFSTFTFI
tara:strand:- start:1820 stop:2344 length:525 start_codon:yes stop_codon:yes gene_type:complete